MARQKNDLTIRGTWTKHPKSIDDARGSLTQFLDGSDGDIYRSLYEVSFRQAKMVRANHYHWKKTEYMRVIRGAIRLELEDLRETSDTFQQRNSLQLSAASGLMVRVPAGVAHALISLTPNTVVQVLATEHHDPTDDHEHQLVPTRGHSLAGKT